MKHNAVQGFPLPLTNSELCNILPYGTEIHTKQHDGRWERKHICLAMN